MASSHHFVCLLWLTLWNHWMVDGKPTVGSMDGISSSAPIGSKVIGGSTSSAYSHQNPFKSSDLFGVINQHELITSPNGIRNKRTPSGFTARGFHEGAFDRDFGHFSPVKRTWKRRPEGGKPSRDASGFYGDTFSNGFGEFDTMKRDGTYLNDDEIRQLMKRTEMGANGLHGDTFNQGFGNFGTMKRKWFDSEVMKRQPEMTKSGLHSDVFNGGFGEFYPMKK